MSLLSVLREMLSVWVEELATRTYERRVQSEIRRIEAQTALLKARLNAQSEVRLLFLEGQHQIASAQVRLLGAEMEARFLSVLSLPLHLAAPLLSDEEQKAQLYRNLQSARLPPAPPVLEAQFLPLSPTEANVPDPPRLEPLVSDGEVKALIAQSVARLRGLEPDDAERALATLETTLAQRLPPHLAREVAQQVRETWMLSRSR